MDGAATKHEVQLQTQGQWTSHALEWGIASILIGVLILAVAPIGAAAAAVGLGFYFTNSGVQADSVRMTCNVIVVTEILVIGLALIGFLFGVVGLRQARSRGLPAGIPTAGVTICGFVIAAAVVALVVTLMTKRDMLRSLEGQTAGLIHSCYHEGNRRSG